MKKKYDKPFIALESYQLNAAVANACSSLGHIAINHVENTCTFDSGQFYNYTTCQVDLTNADLDEHDSICYHGPTASGGIVFVWS